MEMKKSRKWFLPILAAMCAMAAAACNTVAGAGRDVSAAGGAVTGAAQDTQQQMQH